MAKPRLWNCFSGKKINFVQPSDEKVKSYKSIQVKKIILLLFLVESIVCFSQEKPRQRPDYKKIEKDILNKESNLYYPKLFERYILSDTSMTLEEKRNVYYGYTFHPDYSPYDHSKFLDSLKPVISKQNLTQDDYNLILKFCDSVLKSNPFEMRAINYKLYSYKKTNDSVMFNKYLFKMDAIFDAILSSGDGISKETAFYVITTSHEYDVLEVLGFKFGGSQSLIGDCDFLTVEDNNAGIKGFYFNVSPCFDYLHKMFKK